MRAPKTHLPAPWAAENKARLAEVRSGSKPNASVIWPMLFVMTVPPPTIITDVYAISQLTFVEQS